MPEKRARVFISHSAKEDRAREIQEALYAALKESALLAPLLDKSDLEPGDMWRARINLWAGGCDAAVILLSEKALASDWVFYEAALLTYRRDRDPTFLVVPVYVDVDAETVKASRLHPTEITAIQAVHGAGQPVADVVAGVLLKLEKAVCCVTSPVERRAQRLADLFDGFKEKHLREAAAWIQYDLKPWLPADDAQLLLAVQLQSVGMKVAVPALLSLAGHLTAGLSEQERSDWLQKVVDLVASSWVDDRTIARIPPIAKGLAAPYAVGLNAASPVTARMYVLCSSAEDPQPWKLVPCDGIVGQDKTESTIAELVGKVGRVLATELKSKPEAVAEVLKKRSALFPRPLFVSLPGAGISEEILTALRAAFPRVTFFLLMGTTLSGGSPLSDSVLEILFPHLVHGDEDLFLDTYESFQGNVTLP